MSDLSETPFRLYRLSDSSGIECICSADDVSLGDALMEQKKKGETIVGIQYRPIDGEPGEWLVSPWHAVER